MKKRKLKLGDVYKIPLPDGRFAYGRLFKEFTLGIYKDILEEGKVLPSNEKYMFFVGVYKDLLQDGEWTVIENRPFLTDDDAWGPPLCVIDKLSGKYSMYLRGQIIPSTKEACEGLEQAAAWDRNHVIDRIMGDTKWNV